MGYFDKDISAATKHMLEDLENHREHVKEIFNDLLSHRFEE
jgi:hypothetical protein